MFKVLFVSSVMSTSKVSGSCFAGASAECVGDADD
jgi:hypothetical protein